VSALQLLRDRFGRSIAVRATDPDGLGAVVSGEPMPLLRDAAAAFTARGLFDRAAPHADGVAVRIPSPERLAPIDLDQALETAFSVTAAFETAGDKFQQVTGNFDGAGLSFGPAQVNFGTGTLVPLFRKFQAADQAALRGCFTDEDDCDDWLRVLDRRPARSPGPTADQPRRPRRDRTVEGLFPWWPRRPVPRNHGRDRPARWRPDGARHQRLQRLRPDSASTTSAASALRPRRPAGQPRQGVADDRGARDEGEPAGSVRADADCRRGTRPPGPAWQADAISRRVGILKGKRTRSTIGSGRTSISTCCATRVTSMAALLSGDVGAQLARSARRSPAAAASGIAVIFPLV
jgi:hypothetical protein